MILEPRFYDGPSGRFHPAVRRVTADSDAVFYWPNVTQFSIAEAKRWALTAILNANKPLDQAFSEWNVFPTGDAP